MGSPQEWGALDDSLRVGDGDGGTTPHSSLMDPESPVKFAPQDAFAASSAGSRLSGHPVRVFVEEASAQGTTDRLVLMNLHDRRDRLTLAPCGPGRSAKLRFSAAGASLEGGECEGRLAAVARRRHGGMGVGCISLHFEPEPAGPFVQWLPVQRRLLQHLLPASVADEVLSFLPDAWAVPSHTEVTVSAEGVAPDLAGPLAAALWWPLMLDDWVLVGEAQAPLAVAKSQEQWGHCALEAVARAAPAAKPRLEVF
jgi:hypothetical protein